MKKTHADIVTHNLVALIKKKHLEKGLSHQTLADLAGVNRSTVSRIESSKRLPTILVCLKVCDAMDESLWKLLKQAEK